MHNPDIISSLLLLLPLVYSIGRWMQSAVVRVWPKAGHVLETFRVPYTEGSLQDESVEMVPEHVVLKDDGMYTLNMSYVYVCVCNIFIYYGLSIYSYTSVVHWVASDFLYKCKVDGWRRFRVNTFFMKYIFIFFIDLKSRQYDGH